MRATIGWRRDERAPGDAMSALTEAISRGKGPILEAWRKAAFPAQEMGFSFPHQAKGRFADPASFHEAEGMDAILSWLADEKSSDIPELLGEICRVKAVQDAAPSAALAFLFDLKPALRSVVGDAADEAAFRALDARIDTLALHAFDRYVACRNQIAQLRVDEVLRGEEMLRRQLARIQKNGEEPV